MRKIVNYNGVEFLLIPLAEIAKPEVRDEMRLANLIFGWDMSRDVPVIFWGVAALRKAVNRNEPLTASIMMFEYDQDIGAELEYLCAAVKTIKGACCYER
ncbi:MAG: hypothetical protein ABSH08_02210 [Tepidisphaeraceae bacterium]|jgi:hypothetical protein